MIRKPISMRFLAGNKITRIPRPATLYQAGLAARPRKRLDEAGQADSLETLLVRFRGECSGGGATARGLRS